MYLIIIQRYLFLGFIVTFLIRMKPEFVYFLYVLSAVGVAMKKAGLERASLSIPGTGADRMIMEGGIINTKALLPTLLKGVRVFLCPVCW